MQKLRELKLLNEAIFMMFRIGEPRWLDDVKTLSKKYPAVKIAYHCSENA